MWNILCWLVAKCTPTRSLTPSPSETALSMVSDWKQLWRCQGALLRPGLHHWGIRGKFLGVWWLFPQTGGATLTLTRGKSCKVRWHLLSWSLSSPTQMLIWKIPPPTGSLMGHNWLNCWCERQLWFLRRSHKTLTYPKMLSGSFLGPSTRGLHMVQALKQIQNLLQKTVQNFPTL